MVKAVEAEVEARNVGGAEETCTMGQDNEPIATGGSLELKGFQAQLLQAELLHWLKMLFN